MSNQKSSKYLTNREYAQILKTKYKQDWVNWIKQNYPPYCQGCNKQLIFKNYDYAFDHRHGGEESIGSPGEFIAGHKLTKENIEKWKSCDFGLLCNVCNRFLPTDLEDRQEKIKNLLKYVSKT